MKLAFDFVCDEAPLFAGVAERFVRDGAQVTGLTMGRRWQGSWNGRFDTQALSGLFAPVPGLEEELRRIEDEYGASNPGSFLLADRFLCQRPPQQQRLALVNTFHVVEEFFRQEKPDVYFSTGVAYLYNLVCLAVCSRTGIPHVSMFSTRQSAPRLTVSLGRGDRWDLVDREYDELQDQEVENTPEYREAKEYLAEFQEEADQPFYMAAARQSFGLRLVFVRELLTRLRYWYGEGWGGQENDYITQLPFWYVRRDLLKIARAQYVIHCRERIFDRPAAGEAFYLFPLHLQPEASTLVHAEWYVDQLNTIRNVARCLPADTFLYVKEHKSALGRHGLRFYRELRTIHNVRLIAHDADTPALIRHSRGVIILSSTVGWEAVLLNRPVYLLGKVFYQGLEGVVPVSNFGELRERLAQKEGVGLSEKGRDRLVRFLMAIRRQSFEGVFDVAKMDMRARVLAADNVERVYKGLRDALPRIINSRG